MRKSELLNKKGFKMIRLLLVFALIVVVGGCGTNEGGSSGKSSLVGVWKREPLFDKDQGWTIKTVEFKEKTASSTTEFCDTSKCEKISLKRGSYGTYSVSGQNIDFTIKKIAIVALTEGLSTELEDDVAYGVESWSVGAEVNITDRTYEGGYKKYRGKKVFNIYHVTGDTLLMGKRTLAEDSESERGRPDTLDEEAPYKRLK